MGAPSYADDDTDQLLGDGSARQWEPDTGR